MCGIVGDGGRAWFGRKWWHLWRRAEGWNIGVVGRRMTSSHVLASYFCPVAWADQERSLGKKTVIGSWNDIMNSQEKLLSFNMNISVILSTLWWPTDWPYSLWLYLQFADCKQENGLFILPASSPTHEQRQHFFPSPTPAPSTLVQEEQLLGAGKWSIARCKDSKKWCFMNKHWP